MSALLCRSVGSEVQEQKIEETRNKENICVYIRLSKRTFMI